MSHLGLVVLACVAVACSAPHRRAVPPPTAAGAPGIYVAVGASETIGDGTEEPLREAWPQLVFAALPPAVDFVNLGFRGAVTSDAIRFQLPVAESLHPTVATVWLNVNDLIAGVSTTDYATSIRVVVHRLRATGARVFVANTPPLDHLPLYLRCLPADAVGCPAEVPRPLPPPALLDARVDDYNRAVAEVVASEGAQLVDLHAAGLAARTDGSEAALVSADGFHPSTAGHRRVADAFVAAMRAGGVTLGAPRSGG